MQYLIVVDGAEHARSVHARSAEEAIRRVRRTTGAVSGSHYRVLPVGEGARPTRPSYRSSTSGGRREVVADSSA